MRKMKEMYVNEEVEDFYPDPETMDVYTWTPYGFVLDSELEEFMEAYPEIREYFDYIDNIPDEGYEDEPVYVYDPDEQLTPIEVEEYVNKVLEQDKLYKILKLTKNVQDVDMIRNIINLTMGEKNG